MSFFIVLCAFVVVWTGCSCYEVPDATIEVLSPKGFRVSIPDEEGIKLFAFHGRLNQEMNGREGGEFSRDITKAKNGRWTFIEPYTKLKVGDKLYYWTYVDYYDGRNKLGYTNDDNTFEVTELIDESNMSIDIRGGPCGSTVTVASSGRVCKGQLIFSEDFNTDVQNNKAWTVEQKYADAPDYEFVMYMNRPETLSVSNGILKIKPVLADQVLETGFVTSREGYNFGEQCTSVRDSPTCNRRYQPPFILPPVVSSQITTKHNFTFKYGKIEIRAKLPKGDWIYPELFLNPSNEEYGSNYESGQIRIAFAAGNSRYNKVLHGGILLGFADAARKYGLKTLDGTIPWSNDFHNFVLIWRPESISLSVDGTTYGNIFPPASGFASLKQNLHIDYADRWKSGSSLAPFDKNMHLTIGVGVGGFNFDDNGDGSKPWKNGERLIVKKFYNAQNQWKATWNDESALEVDYIKVWAL